jgi:mannose-6-phosphate isomerase-like protein (cupin superfamily)
MNVQPAFGRLYIFKTSKHFIIMQTKYNEATVNRPEGNRILDAPFVFMDLAKYSRQLKNEEGWHKHDRNSITIYKTKEFTMTLCWLREEALIMDNLVGGHVTIQVIEGSIDFTVEGSTTELTQKQMITIHPFIMHTIRAVSNSLLLMVTTKMES